MLIRSASSGGRTGVLDPTRGELRAIAALVSRFEGVTQAGESYPRGSRSLPDQVRVAAARYGSSIRKAYGEPFRTRQELECDTLGGPTVATS